MFLVFCFIFYLRRDSDSDRLEASHGRATSTQVCIPGRGAVLLEGAGRETPTKVKTRSTTNKPDLFTECQHNGHMFHFWPVKVVRVACRADESQAELQEFQQMSRDYEAELEAELKQCEGRNKELRLDNNRLHMDLENIKVKRRQCTSLDAHLFASGAWCTGMAFVWIDQVFPWSRLSDTPTCASTTNYPA